MCQEDTAGFWQDAVMDPQGAQFSGPLSVAEAIGALGEQVSCYRVLAKLAERQHGYVQNGQTEELIALLAERQGVLDRLTVLARQTAGVKQNLGTLGAAERAKVEGMLGETKRLLAEITAGDERDALVLQQRKHRLGTEIRATSSAHKVNRSYAANAYGRKQVSYLDEVR